MIRLRSIKSRLVFFSIVAFLSVAFCASLSYVISISEIKTIMKTDISSVADAMEKNLNYVARIKPDALQDPAFRKSVYSVKVGKSGYPFMLDEQGVLIVHPKDEGKSLAGQPHIEYIRSHKEGGFYEYTAKTTGQDKIVAFRYIAPWNAWIVPGVNKADYYDILRQTFLKWNLIFAALNICILTLTGYWISRGIVNPVRDAVGLAHRMAGGDLTSQARYRGEIIDAGEQVKDGDEIRELLCALNGMAGNLNTMVGKINRSAGELFQISHSISGASGQVTGSARIQAEAVNNTSSAITEINTSIKEVADGVHNVSLLVSESSSSILEMASSIEEVAQNAELLAGSVEEVSSSVVEMIASIKQVGDNVTGLSEVSATAASSLIEMDSSIKHVEQHASETSLIAEEVRTDAAMGQKSVEAMISGMEEIRDASRISSEVIRNLASRTSDIGKIISVIEEVANRTNLLALNAAIIAAQAGEHGKSFAVVADEIKRLAERTRISTQEIGTVIKGVQDDTVRAVEAISRAEISIGDGELLSKKSGEALNMIVAAAEKAFQRMEEIVRATVEQGQGSRMVRDAMTHVADMVTQIAGATREQEKGSGLIITNVAKMKELTSQTRSSSREQSDVGKTIARSVEEITRMIQQINRACDEQRRGSGQIMLAVEDIQDATAANMESSQVLNKSMENLAGQTEILRQEMGAFKVKG